MTLRLSEMYTSVQGEGQHFGKPTIFVRFAGCNMRCPGWPCDTQHAIQPAIWYKEMTKHSSMSLFQAVIEETKENNAYHVCLTGGEPFMQPTVELEDFAHELWASPEYSTEVFTNGSYELPEWALEDCDIMMDWKLQGSGESGSYRDQRFRNLPYLKSSDGIKFVVKHSRDLDEALELTERFKNITKAELWVGAVWGEITDAHIVNYMKQTGAPWRLNVQVHKFIWPAEARRT